jgi:hypothetical protein
VIRDELIRRNQLRVERRQVIDHVQDVAIALVRPNVDQFTADEIAIANGVIADMRRYTNTEASDDSHQRSAGWRAKKLGETIEYETWLIDPEPADAEALAFLQRAEGLPA